MTVIVFTGPTLAPAEAVAELDAVYRPPAAQGDVYRASLDRPRVIGIVDGHFESVPAVWHKEILWAMSEGIHVFGSASMGALRAAELAAFGMEGVGAVFAAFRDGVLEDDDEVAVLHGPREAGYVTLTDAMVNIRETLARAVGEGILRPGAGEALLRAAKTLHYKDRTYAGLLDSAPGAGLDPGDARRLRDWLPIGQVDRKRQDAVEMLRAIRGRLAAGLAPKAVSYHFEYTEAWHRLRSRSRFRRN